MILVERENQFAKDFLQFIDDLVIETLKIAEQKKKFREIITGKITNIKDWNYLNPIGELALLRKLTLNGYKLKNIEDKQKIPTSSPKDFLFQDTKKNEILIEVVNIHLDDSYASLDELKDFLHAKTRVKIDKETDGLKGNNFDFIFYFQPILWNFNLSELNPYSNYFKNFASTFGRDVSKKFKTLGFCTFGRDSNGQFVFGEISSFYSNYVID